MLGSILLIFVLILNFVDVKNQSNDTLCNTTPLSRTLAPMIFDQSPFARELQLHKIFRYLRIRRNITVADVGAGGGWLTVTLAKFIGPMGKVYAQDISPHHISIVEDKIKIYDLNNVETIVGSSTDSKLPKNTLDAVIVLNAYHEFEKPITMMIEIQEAMKVGARLGIIDRDIDEMRVEARAAYTQFGYIASRVNETTTDITLPSNHYLALDVVVREAVLVGFKFLFSRELGGNHYVAIFLKT